MAFVEYCVQMEDEEDGTASPRVDFAANEHSKKHIHDAAVALS